MTELAAEPAAAAAPGAQQQFYWKAGLTLTTAPAPGVIIMGPVALACSECDASGEAGDSATPYVITHTASCPWTTGAQVKGTKA